MDKTKKKKRKRLTRTGHYNIEMTRSSRRVRNATTVFAELFLGIKPYLRGHTNGKI